MRPDHTNPPRLARWLLQLGLRGEAREAIAGDLEEEFRRHILPTIGPRAARRWFWRQALHSIAAGWARTPVSEPRPIHSKGDSNMHGFWQDVRYGARRHGIRLAAAGVALGIVGALAATRLMRSLLFAVTPSDPLTYAAISVVLLAVGLLACWVPARRATRVDPMVALRYE